MNKLLILVKRLFIILGIDIKLLKNKDSDIWLKKKKIRTIIDIGANSGQFASKMRKLFPDARIISFEPLPDEFNKLNNRFKKDTFFESYNMAIGDVEETIQMFQNEFSASSSILEIDKIHITNFPETYKTKVINVKSIRLDDFLRNRSLDKQILIKIDVQGFENKVINGGKEILNSADILIIEMSFYPLYKEQPLFHEIYTSLFEIGFVFQGIYDQLYSPIDRTILQADGIFTRKAVS